MIFISMEKFVDTYDTIYSLNVFNDFFIKYLDKETLK